jgi:hypothetical protein
VPVPLQRQGHLALVLAARETITWAGPPAVPSATVRRKLNTDPSVATIRQIARVMNVPEHGASSARSWTIPKPTAAEIQFLAHIRETDAIETIATELILADPQTLDKAVPRLERGQNQGSRTYACCDRRCSCAALPVKPEPAPTMTSRSA